jgi:hypothetical protein
MRVIGKLWNGDYPLSTAFWGFYVGLSVLSIIAAVPILAVAINAPDRIHTIVYQVLVAIRIVLLIWTSVGVWRSAKTYVDSSIQRNVIAGYAARFVVIAWAVRVVAVNVALFSHALSN